MPRSISIVCVCWMIKYSFVCCITIFSCDHLKRFVLVRRDAKHHRMGCYACTHIHYSKFVNFSPAFWNRLAQRTPKWLCIKHDLDGSREGVVNVNFIIIMHELCVIASKVLVILVVCFIRFFWIITKTKTQKQIEWYWMRVYDLKWPWADFYPKNCRWMFRSVDRASLEYRLHSLPFRSIRHFEIQLHPRIEKLFER